MPYTKTPEQIYRMHIYHVIADIILIFVIAAVGIYLWLHFREFEMLGQDVCKLCMAHTHSICFQ